MVSPWLDDLNCGSCCCNTTLPPPTTCVRVLRENTGFCVGVRHPHSREPRYIRLYDRWHGLPEPLCGYAWTVGGTAALELERNLFVDKTCRWSPSKYCWKCIFFNVSAQRVRVHADSTLGLRCPLWPSGGRGVRLLHGCLCSCGHLCCKAIKWILRLQEEEQSRQRTPTSSSNCLYHMLGLVEEGAEGPVAQPVGAWMLMWSELSRPCEADRRRILTRSLCLCLDSSTSRNGLWV